MTQSAVQQQQPSAQQQTAVLAGMLASTMPLAGLVAGFVTLTGLPSPVARRLIEQTPSHVGALTVRGPASRLVASAEPTYRAAYLLAAAGRVRTSMTAGMSVEEALAAEQRFTVAHLQAQANRARAAVAVDKAAAQHRSGLLGWKARMDSRTSAECRAADGRNFSVFAPPAIGLPGSVHPHCRCRPVAAFAGAPMVGEQTRKVAVA